MLPQVQTAPARRKALYALSADPITYGHINIVGRVTKLFDEVIFGVGNNPTKNYLFSLEERLALAKASLAHLPNVQVLTFRGMLTDFALEQKADVVVKGVRNNADFDYELLLHQVGLSQQAGIDTHVLFADPHLSHVSSSVVKAIQQEHGFIHEYVPLPVKAALEKSISQQTIIGVTGPIASGKTTLCQRLITCGEKENIDVHHINSDKLGHAVLADTSNDLFKATQQQIIDLLGNDIVENKVISRPKLAQQIFANPRLRTQVNQLMLGPIQLQVRKQLANKRGIILLESALLTEASLLPLCNNRVITVQCPDQIRNERMCGRGYRDNDIQARNLAQFDVQQKVSVIKTQIDNDRFGFLWEVSGYDSSESAIYSLLMDVYELGREV